MQYPLSNRSSEFPERVPLLLHVYLVSILVPHPLWWASEGMVDCLVLEPRGLVRRRVCHFQDSVSNVRLHSSLPLNYFFIHDLSFPFFPCIIFFLSPACMSALQTTITHTPFLSPSHHLLSDPHSLAHLHCQN